MNISKFLFFIFGIWSINNNVSAQTDTIKLDHFKLPTTPAATILNMGANTISRPTTTQGVATSLISGFGGAGGIQPNISIEFAPFWLKPRRDLDFYTYYGLNKKNFSPIVTDVMENVRQTLSLSIATSKIGDQKDTLDGTRMAIGFRTQLFSGKASSEMINEVQSLLQKMEVKNVIFSSLREMQSQDYLEEDSTKKIFFRVRNNAISIAELATCIKKEISATLDFYRGNLDPDKIKASAFSKIDELEALVSVGKISISESLGKLWNSTLDKADESLQLQKIKQSNKNKVGFIWEIAGAGVQYFPQNSFERSLYQKTGIWSTMSYRSDNQKSEFSLLVRQTFSKSDSVNTNFDLGFSATRIVDQGFNYGLELIYRSYSYRFPTKDINGNNIQAIQSGNTYRLALNMEYKISDVVSLTASIGKDFNGPFVTKNNLLSVIGANFSIPTLAGFAISR